MFHVTLPIDAQQALRAHEVLISQGGPTLSLRIRTNPDPTRSSFEVILGESSMALSPEEIADAVG